MSAFTNKHNIPIGIAAWLLHDNYDYIPDQDYISATGLLKPLRQIILPPRIPSLSLEQAALAGIKLVGPDISEFIARRRGQAIHDSIESAWTGDRWKTALSQLGIPQTQIDQILINPTDEQIDEFPNHTALFLEQRMIVEFAGFRIGGKFDMLFDGMIEDTKTTSTFAYTGDSHDGDYILQGSIYRWLDSKMAKPKVTEDFMRINFIFSDWMSSRARQDPTYPQVAYANKLVPLMSVEETEEWIRQKLKQIVTFYGKPETEIPPCSAEELWQDDPVWKYYSNEANIGGRSTKNFTSSAEAEAHRAKAGKGIVVEVPGKAKRCMYCDAFPVCTQKDGLIL